MEQEIYAADIAPELGLMACGGGANTAEVYDYLNERTVCSLEDFPESVIYIKILPSGKFVVVSMDGTLLLATGGDDSTVISLEEDISASKFNEYLVIGTDSGRVYLYNSELEHINTFGGHSTQILSVDYCEGRIYSLSTHNLLVHDEYGRYLHTLKSHDATSFCHIGGDVLCLGREARVQVFKGTNKLFELPSDFVVDTVDIVGKNLIVGGVFEYLVLVDTTFRYATYKLETGVKTLKVKGVDENTVVFSTPCEQMGVLDIRDISTLRLFSSLVGTVFDFAIGGNRLLVGGENGSALFDMDGTCLFQSVSDIDISAPMNENV